MPGPLEIYATLREDRGDRELAALRLEVRAHYERLVRKQRTHELLATDLAEILCCRLENLLACAPALTSEERASVVGAALYFVSEADAVPDHLACTGLDDDVEVFNHVALSLGRKELVIRE